MSLSLRRAWIEIQASTFSPCETVGRSPYGERGLKFMVPGPDGTPYPGRSPYGERGLKFREETFEPPLAGRSPYGERGLKYVLTGCC